MSLQVVFCFLEITLGFFSEYSLSAPFASCRARSRPWRDGRSPARLGWAFWRRKVDPALKHGACGQAMVAAETSDAGKGAREWRELELWNRGEEVPYCTGDVGAETAGAEGARSLRGTDRERSRRTAEGCVGEAVCSPLGLGWTERTGRSEVRTRGVLTGEGLVGLGQLGSP